MTFSSLETTGIIPSKKYITHIYSGEKDKCSALVTRNNKIKLLELGIIIKIMIKLLVYKLV